MFMSSSSPFDRSKECEALFAHIVILKCTVISSICSGVARARLPMSTNLTNWVTGLLNAIKVTRLRLPPGWGEEVVSLKKLERACKDLSAALECFFQQILVQEDSSSPLTLGSWTRCDRRYGTFDERLASKDSHGPDGAEMQVCGGVSCSAPRLLASNLISRSPQCCITHCCSAGTASLLLLPPPSPQTSGPIADLTNAFYPLLRAPEARLEDAQARVPRSAWWDVPGGTFPVEEKTGRQR